MVAIAPQPTRNVAPMQGERSDAFVARADRALRRSIPDRVARMSMIFKLWQQSPIEQQLQARVRQALSSIAEDPNRISTTFVTKPNRPIFAEHETVGPDGERQRYDREALAAIVDRCNRRILDTGDLSAMSAGHTPTNEQMEKGMPMPACVGYSGPFRLGIIGDEQPRWAIFTDEHIFADDYPQVRKWARRSPEVWMAEEMGDRVLDPIAVLGAETPRLDTGLSRFSRRLSPARYTNVCRYSAGSAAMPSGTNTFVTTDKYSGADAMDEQTKAELVKDIVGALMSTAQMQWVTQQMQADGGNPVPADSPLGEPEPTDDSMPDDDTDQPQLPEPNPGNEDAPADAPPPAAPPADKPKDKFGTMQEPAQDQPVTPAHSEPDGDEATPEELASMADDERDEYSRLAPTNQHGYMMARRRFCRYSQASDSTAEKARYSRMESELGTVKKELAILRQERTKTHRYSKLAELAQTYEFDANEESNDCAAMTDDQFNRHCERTIAKYARRDPMGGMPSVYAPPLDMPASADEVKKERYSKRAIEIATRSASSGKAMSWDEALEQAKKEIDGK